MITLEDYFGRVSHIEKPSAEVIANATELLGKVNALLDDLAVMHPDEPIFRDPHVNSGWRPESYNATIPNAAAKSKHITGHAIDIGDPEGVIDDILLNSPELLKAYGLYLEHPSASKGWTHLQSIPPRSGNLVFFP